MKLMRNEMSGDWNRDYFGKIFHNICIHRKDFVIEKLMGFTHEFVTDYSYLIPNFHCPECDSKIVNVNYVDGNFLKCMFCKKDPFICCSRVRGEYRLCNDCTNVVLFCQKM